MHSGLSRAIVNSPSPKGSGAYGSQKRLEIPCTAQIRRRINQARNKGQVQMTRCRKPGRPPLPAGKRKFSTTLYTTPAQSRALARAARRRATSQGALIREGIAHVLTKYKTKGAQT